MSELENKAKQLTDEELEKVTGGIDIDMGQYKRIPSCRPIGLVNESDVKEEDSKASGWCAPQQGSGSGGCK